MRQYTVYNPWWEPIVKFCLVTLCALAIFAFISYNKKNMSTSNATYGSHYTQPRNNSVFKSNIGSNNLAANSALSSIKRPGSSKGNKPRGLTNLTNTCYISACLQVLFIILPQSLKKGPVSKRFFELKATHDTLDYKLFKKQVQKQLQIVQGWQQQDAQQFLLGLLEIMNQQNSETKPYNNFNPTYDQKKSPLQNWKKFKDQMHKIQNSQIIDHFYAQTLVQMQCQKNHKKHLFERYNHLSLTFPSSVTKPSSSYSSSSYYNSYQSKDDIKLKDMIDKQLKQEQIEGLHCESCQKNTKFRKTSKHFTLPQILICTLSRFKKTYYSQQKINNHVSFDQQLTLLEEKSGKSIKYKLIAVINHYGTLHRGHYFAQVLVNDHWYEVNDDDVRLSTIKSKGQMSKYVYILFYQKV